MGVSGISIWKLLIILAIVIALFGTKRLRTLGGDLGSMIKGFKDSMTNANNPEAQAQTAEAKPQDQQQVVTAPQAAPAAATAQTADKVVDQPNKV